MARKAAKRATNVNAVLLACERSQIFFSLDHQQEQQQKQHPTSMPKRAPAKEDSEVYEVEDILDDRLDPKVGMVHIARDIHNDSLSLNFKSVS